MKINYLDTKMGGGEYVSPHTEIIELQGGPCMGPGSPDSTLPTMIASEIYDEDF